MIRLVYSLGLMLCCYSYGIGQNWFPPGGSVTYTYINAESLSAQFVSAESINLVQWDTINTYPVTSLAIDNQCNIDIAYLGFQNDSVYYFSDSLDFFLLFKLSQNLPDTFTTYRPRRCSTPGMMNYDTLNYQVDSIAVETFNGVDVHVYRGNVQIKENSTIEKPFTFYEYFGFAEWTFTPICDACESSIQDLRCYEDGFFGQVQIQASPCDTAYVVGIRNQQEKASFAHLITSVEEQNLSLVFNQQINSLEMDLHIYNALGQVVFHQDLDKVSQTLKIDNHSWPQGIYFIQVADRFKTIWQQEFIKY